MRRARFLPLVGVLACASPLRTLPPPTAGAAPEDAAALAAQAHAAVQQSEHAATADARAAEVDKAVEAGQRCQQVAPASPACDYALALALGVQAREHPTTATKGLKLMVELLQRATASDPKQDQGGPPRVLALVLVRAPGWPLGPGDPEAGLKAAQDAVGLFPDHPPNQLAFSEALLVNGEKPASKAAAGRGLALAQQAAARGEPDASGWIRDAETLISGKAPR
ncbi:MAG: hypothetical protein ACXU81_03685 [Myxococcaceae bacterium]